MNPFSQIFQNLCRIHFNRDFINLEILVEGREIELKTPSFPRPHNRTTLQAFVQIVRGGKTYKMGVTVKERFEDPQ